MSLVPSVFWICSPAVIFLVHVSLFEATVNALTFRTCLLSELSSGVPWSVFALSAASRGSGEVIAFVYPRYLVPWLVGAPGLFALCCVSPVFAEIVLPAECLHARTEFLLAFLCLIA